MLTKKTKIIFAVMGVCLITIISFYFVRESRSVDNLIKPYEDVVTKVNDMLGANMAIPEENKEKTYEMLKDMPLEEFENLLIQQYKESMQYEDSQAIHDDGDFIYQDASKLESPPIQIPNSKGIIEVNPIE